MYGKQVLVAMAVVFSAILFNKLGMLTYDGLGHMNSGEKLLSSDVLQTAERLNLNAIKPYILQPTVSLPNKLSQHHEHLSRVEQLRHEIVILILTAPKNNKKRMKFRSNFTIGGEKPHIIFLLGKVVDEDLQLNLENENRMFGDILQISVTDSYQNLAYKSIAGLDYVSQKSEGVDFIIKLDDDLEVNTEALRNSLISKSPLSDHSLYCYPLKNAHPWRRRFGPFGLFGKDNMVVSHELWPADKYPDYCLGWVYALTPALASKLVNVTALVPFHKIDDLYVTGLLRLAAAAKIEMLSSSWLLHSFIWQLLSRCWFVTWIYHLLFYDIAIEAPDVNPTNSLFMLMPLSLLTEYLLCYYLMLPFGMKKSALRRPFVLMFIIFV